MAKKPSVTTISSGFASNTQLNTNFTALRDAFDNTLSLDGSTPNAMQADLDLNGNSLLNVADLEANNLILDGQAVVGLASVPAWRGAWTTGVSYAKNDLIKEAGSSYICLVAHTAGTFSTDLAALKWELFAEKGAAGAGTGDMLAANNLSDVADPATARNNIGAQTADTTLTALASFNTNGLLAQTASDTFAGRTLTAGSGISITNGDGVSGNPTVAANLSSQAEAEAGTDNTKLMTPLRAAQHLQSKNINRGTSVNTTSGTAIDFTGIPSWARRITVAFNAVSLSGTDSILVQLGSTTFTTSGYASSGTYFASGSASAVTTVVTSGFLIATSLASRSFSGNMEIVNLSGNIWTEQNGGSVGGGGGHVGGGVITLGGVLDRLRITVTGSNTFDAGSVNIFWE